MQSQWSTLRVASLVAAGLWVASFFLTSFNGNSGFECAVLSLVLIVHNPVLSFTGVLPNVVVLLSLLRWKKWSAKRYGTLAVSTVLCHMLLFLRLSSAGATSSPAPSRYQEGAAAGYYVWALSGSAYVVLVWMQLRAREGAHDPDPGPVASGSSDGGCREKDLVP